MRKEVVAKAREFNGTPFQHQGRIKGTALDCVGLPLCVAEELGIVDKNGVPLKSRDNLNYSAQPQDQLVHQECQNRLIQKPIEQMADGDVVTLRVPSIPCHVAIVTLVDGVWHMIHAYTGNRKCAEHVMDDKWKKRIEGVFSFPGVE